MIDHLLTEVDNDLQFLSGYCARRQFYGGFKHTECEAFHSISKNGQVFLFESVKPLLQVLPIRQISFKQIRTALLGVNEDVLVAPQSIIGIKGNVGQGIQEHRCWLIDKSSPGGGTCPW